VGIKFKEKFNKVATFGASFVWCLNLEIPDSRSEVLEKF
jgi:hypothetical protein